MRHLTLIALAVALSAAPLAAAETIRVEFQGHFTDQYDPFDLLPEGLEVGNPFTGWCEFTEPERVDNLPGDAIQFRIGFAFETEGLEWGPIGFANIFNDVPHLEGKSDSWTGTTLAFPVEEVGTGRQVLRTITLSLVDFDADEITSLVPQIPTSLAGWESARLLITYDRVLLDPGYVIIGTIDRWVVPEPRVGLLLALGIAACLWHRAGTAVRASAWNRWGYRATR